jgi:hypothetical protein
VWVTLWPPVQRPTKVVLSAFCVDCDPTLEYFGKGNAAILMDMSADESMMNYLIVFGVSKN